MAVTGQRWPFLDGISPPPTLHLHDNSTEKASRPGDGCPARCGTPRPAGEAEARLLGYLEAWPVYAGPGSIRTGHKAKARLTTPSQQLLRRSAPPLDWTVTMKRVRRDDGDASDVGLGGAVGHQQAVGGVFWSFLEEACR